VWLAGVLFHWVRLMMGGIGLIRLYRKSVPHIPYGIAEAPFRGLNWQLRLRTSPSESGPLTWGVVRPVVLLPKASVTWPRERLTSVLLHEAAHVRRKDCLCRLIAILASALYWPNPLVWLAARAMRADAECAADDAVLMAGVKPTRYAEHLVGLAREYSGVAFAVSLSMAERRTLDSRVEAILDPAHARSDVTGFDVLKLGAAVLALTVGLALVRPSLAEEEPAPASVATAPQPVARQLPVSPAHHGAVRLAGDRAQSVVPPSPPDAPPVPPVDVPPPQAPAAPQPPAAIMPPQVPSFAERAAMEAEAQANARQAIAQARQALAHANIDQTVRAAMQQAADAMRNANVSDAEAKKVLADIDIDRIVAKAMKKADAAMRKAEAAQARAERRQAHRARRLAHDKDDDVSEDTSDDDE
jgi:hypothetical protein